MSDNIRTGAQDHTLDFCVIGAQKCATSWLYYCLQDHPALCVPTKKLEVGYIGGKMYAEKGADWFFERFVCEPGQIKGDVSVEYLYDRSSPKALKPFAGGAKLIICLRNPVDRMVSGYFWLLRKGDMSNIPLEEGIAEVLKQPAGFPEPLDGPLEEAVRRSCYADQIDGFIAEFGAENIFVYLYEDVEEDGLLAVQRVYRFLGVDADFVPPSLNSAPKKNSYNRWLLAIENSTRSKIVARACNYAHQILTYFRPRKDILPKAIRTDLNRLFRPVAADTKRVLAALPADQRPSDAHIDKHWKLG